MSSNRIQHVSTVLFRLVEGVDTIHGRLYAIADEPGLVAFHVGDEDDAPTVLFDLRTGATTLRHRRGSTFVPMSVEAWVDALRLVTPEVVEAMAAAAAICAGRTVGTIEQAVERSRSYVQEAREQLAGALADVDNDLDELRKAECLRFTLQLPAGSRNAALAMLPSWKGSAVDLVAAARGVVAPAA